MPETVDRKTVRSWVKELDALNERIARRFSRTEVRRRARTYLSGQLGPTERKNSWQLTERPPGRAHPTASSTFSGVPQLGR
jgi:methionine synthase I (cobalamin-dependent)